MHGKVMEEAAIDSPTFPSLSLRMHDCCHGSLLVQYLAVKCAGSLGSNLAGLVAVHAKRYYNLTIFS